MEKGSNVLVFNREINKHEIGTIIDKYRREKVMRYDVKLERGILLEFVSTNSESNFFIDVDLTKKYFKK